MALGMGFAPRSIASIARAAAVPEEEAHARCESMANKGIVFSRVGYFFWYILPVLAFFLINGGVFMYGQARQKAHASGAKTQWIWWLGVLYAGLAGLVVVWLIQYFPWVVMGQGPGFELLGLPQYSALWPLMLLVYIPEFAVLWFMATWFYRRTGRIYLGALMVSSLAIWFLTAGTIIAI